MKRALLLMILRVVAVVFSASMLGGYVWFSQQKAQSMTLPTAKSPVQDGGTDLSVGDVSQTAVTGAGQSKLGTGTLIMSGSKSYSGAVVVAKQLGLDKATEKVAPLSAIPTNLPAGAIYSGAMMPGSKSGTLFVPPPQQVNIASQSVTVTTAPNGGLSLDAKPLEFRGTMGKVNAKADGEGNLELPGSGAAPLTDVSANRNSPADVHTTKPPLFLSGSKSLQVLPPQAAMVDESQTNDPNRILVAPWRFVPDLRWDLRDAVDELGRQIKVGLGSLVPEKSSLAPLMSGSKSAPVLTVNPKVPSVLELPKVPKPAAKP